jgi:hypothetical protein
LSRPVSDRKEWTGFQESRPYGAKYDLRSDFVMVYGISDDLEERIAGWKERGYIIHLMTGVSWGEYQDYLYGKYDGRDHWDEAQTNRAGDHLLHGKDVPYMVPTISFSEYLAAGIKRAIDCGAEAIHLEEPEFWVAGGYSEAFQREWRIFYQEPWIAPHESPDAQYRASKLKAYLYYRTLDRLCAQMKEYAEVQYGRAIRFYVPTHSLINYTQWRIVSPEALLVNMPACDGFIAQVWTGTARTRNVYKGIREERTFETAFLEYGVMQELVRGTGRDMWFLHDPIEDNPNYTWSDYKVNYEDTVVASLLHPYVNNYEICPWPRRVFEVAYPKEDGKGKEMIPPDYATELLTVMHVLRDMHRHEEITSDEQTDGIGLLLANSAMFQRGDIELQSDEADFRYDGTISSLILPSEHHEEMLNWSAFYGLALPLVKHGIPLRPVQLDNLLHFPGYLDDYRVLLLSYEFMKPEHAGLHQVLSQWIRDGGCLIYVGDGSDPYHNVKEWWNQGARAYERPDDHLFEAIGMGRRPEDGEYRVGQGGVIVHRVHPARLAETEDGANWVRESVKRALALRGDEEPLREKHYLQIRRGPYVATRVMTESHTDQAVTVHGSYIDLFDANLAIVSNPVVEPGKGSLLYDLEAAPEQTSAVIISSSRIRDEEPVVKGKFQFVSEAPAGVTVSTRLQLTEEPRLVIADGHEIIDRSWEPASRTLLIRYPGVPEGTLVTVIFEKG